MKYRRLLTILALSFLLGVQNGYITLWKVGCEKPLWVFPYQAEMLPLTDQLALKKGIVIKSDSKLAEFLEDYLS